jgi:hypothetical protein
LESFENFYNFGFEGILSPDYLSNYFQSNSLLNDINSWYIPFYRENIDKNDVETDSQEKIKIISLNMEGYIRNDEINEFITEKLKRESPELIRKSLILTLFKLKHQKKQTKTKEEAPLVKISMIVQDSSRNNPPQDENELLKHKLSIIKSIGLWNSLKIAKKEFVKNLNKLPEKYHPTLAHFLECEIMKHEKFPTHKKFESLLDNINTTLEEKCLLLMKRNDFLTSVDKFSDNYDFWCSNARRAAKFPELTEEEIQQEVKQKN